MIISKYLLVLIPFICSTVTFHASAQDRRDVQPPQWPRHICADLVPADINRLQSLLNDCPSGSAVRLTRGRFVSSPLTITSNVYLWIAQGATLVATTDPTAYDRGTGECGKINDKGNACHPFLLFDHTKDGGLLGRGTIEGQGGQPILGTTRSWWQLARIAQRMNQKQNAPRLIALDHVQNFTMGYITLKNSPNFHVMITQSKDVTLWGITIDTPPDARNTDGIDPSSSHDITIIHSIIRTGDDHIAIKAGPHGASHHISILNSSLYWGHGLSIGSETMGGVHDILVKNIIINGAKWGLRIKSDSTRGGIVERIHYDTVCLYHTQWPIFLDTSYNKNANGNNIPIYKSIFFKNIYIDNGTIYLHGYNKNYLSDLFFKNLITPIHMQWSVAYTNLYRDKSTHEPYIKSCQATSL
ncbi:polygalacturonase [Saccharibacter sp. 17.LH.SD]|uniref:glycoside hydrolase family 28 protein n=1 Tax=Saccharibacter sp. 17.LH.SD TaxID=2689393 RepID=UPI00136D78DF|nr:glycosyl hydrolase family 28 protein [Saccharibacter sp. 17.LH.SD]MXV44943.1 polygalacturonase [Saccharibacter sp. 17.LH.SD]